MSALIDRAIEAAGDALVLADLTDTFVPLVEEALDGAGSLLFEFGADRRPLALSGSLAPHIAAYNATLFGADPLQGALRDADPRSVTVRLEDVVSYETMRRSTAYNEFYRPLGIEQLMGVWPTGQRFGDAGMVGLVIGRAATARRFGNRERRLFERLLPAFRQVIRRDRRVREREREHAIAAVAARNVVPHPVFVLDTRGVPLWISPAADAWLRASADAVDVERALARAARTATERARISIATPQRTLDGTLWLDRLPQGGTAVIVILRDDAATHEQVLATAREHGLTKTEATVLACVARGLENQAIAEELSVSLATVKTHLRQISSKLGVTNRTQAALLAHGLSHPFG